MDRNGLIDYIDYTVSQKHDIKAVLQGLETEHLERIRGWYASDRSEPFPYLIEGESNPFNVYFIEWEGWFGLCGYDGAVYHESDVGTL